MEKVIDGTIAKADGVIFLVGSTVILMYLRFNSLKSKSKS